MISGPSGVGKSTLCRRALKRVGAQCSVSATTRRPRQNETDGVDYEFITPKEFERRRDAGEFLEWAEVFGHLYGTPAGPVRQAVAQGRTILLEIDVQGGLQVHRSYPDAVQVFVLPPSMDRFSQALRDRLNHRGMDDAQEIERRVGQARGEIEQARASGVYSYFVVNDDLDRAVDELVELINKETACHD